MAALQGREDVAKIFLEHGAKLEPRGSDKLYGATPLYSASQNNNLDVVEVLLEAGADVNCRLRNFWSLLICTVYLYILFTYM